MKTLFKVCKVRVLTITVFIFKSMCSPICFSQYFINKQNVRSFSNVINIKLLKSENNEVFLQKVVGDVELLKEISPELRNLLTELRYNIKCCSNRDFKEFLTITEVRQDNLEAVQKKDVLTSCMNALYNIIPYKFFNCNSNSNIFKKCLQVIIYSMNRQYIYLDVIIKRWDINVFPWNTVLSSSALKIINNILQWIFKTLLSAIIALNFFVTTCKIDANENKLHFFWKNQWQAFYDKKISDMVITKVMCRSVLYCISKKLRKSQTCEKILKLRIVKKNTPKLHLVLKSKNQYRPIVCYKNELNQSEKNKVRERLQFMQQLIGKPHEKIENQYKNLHKKWLNKNRPPLYFVKTDLSNAFGSINKEKLLKVLHERYIIFEKKEMPNYVKKKFCQTYKEIIAELRKPLLIRAGSTIYEWKKGLVQGYKYSPALSELYYTYFDEIYFAKHINHGKEEMKLFIRVVDDYLYITNSLDDAQLFLEALSNYNNINLDKTVVNFSHPTIKRSQDITFLGYSYNTSNMQVSRGHTAYAGQVCFKIQFSAATVDLEKFLENRIGQSGIHINSHIFNFYHNSEELVWNHIFLTLCFSANKFCCILAMLCDEKDMEKYLTVYKKKVTVKLCNTIIKTLQKNQPQHFLFIYCINHFRYLSFKALLLCARQTPKCNVLVPIVNVELAKTNCIYGKWSEHSSRIGKSGQNQQEAIRDVCRRSDLRTIMKGFNTLPKEFQCFNHKIFYQ